MRLFNTITVAAILATSAATAQDKVELIYSDTISDNDTRSQLLREEFVACLGDEFEFQAHHGATLFKQGTELTAMQRGNLDMGNLSIYDFYNQVPSTSLLGVPFLFRDYEHMRAAFNSDVLDDLWAEVEEKANVKVLSSPYIGARHISYVGDREYMTPADLDGVKMRFPGGEGWQFVGTAMGATPVPIAFTEVYTSLQTGAVDGQDNGFPLTRSMKFDEILNHVGLTSHLIQTNQFTISLSKWNALSEAQQTKMQECASNFEAAVDSAILTEENDLKDQFVENGITVYMPNNQAFQDHVLQVYRDSKYSADWPEGLVEAIVAVE
ncbi:MAG: TRAP transporter substrate-binding protein DctP [Pseudomonadota bacterium]|nr:TRAP transporter substrate-binding protein DctP [Pseudomonadota bacterium]